VLRAGDGRAGLERAGRAGDGEKGELVCCTPFPSQPVGFWNDPDGEKYRGGLLRSLPRPRRLAARRLHRDHRHGGVIVYGRSDATLNPGGVRIGTAEIYRVVEAIPEIVDSIVVGRDVEDGDVEVCLFVVLRSGVALTTELTRQVRDAIAAGCTAVSEIPYTISGKKVEMAVRRVIHGQDVPNRDALKNPAALDEFAPALAEKVQSGR
jgi:acetoacetyl-CoA synthetase